MSFHAIRATLLESIQGIYAEKSLPQTHSLLDGASPSVRYMFAGKMLFGCFTSALLACAVSLSLLAYVWQRFCSLQGLPASLPWAGAEYRGAFSRANAARQSFFGMRQLIVKGYSKYSRSEKPFILPNLATGAEVILPLSQLRWLLDQPDYILSQAEVNTEFLRADWTMLHPSIATGSVHGPIIRREMTKGLDTYADAVVNEIQYSLGLVWGDSTQWHEIVVYDTMLDVISRISNRALVGFPLCRNESYLRSSRTFARFVIITAGLINLLPSMLRPILGPLIIARDIYHYHKIARLIFPIIKNRMADFQLGNDYKKPDYSVHNDYIHWALHHAFSQDDPIERTPEMITKRLVVLTFGTIQSSVITITNALVDIASSPSSVEVQEGLREEVEGATTPPNSESWKTSNLVKMVRIDSVLRESMRLWGFISRGVMKMVMVREGIKIPSGEHLPFGAKVGVSAYAIHHDEAMYPNAFMFDAFRFSRPLGAVMLGTTGNDAAEMLPMVKSTNNFMGFSHGRNTCPGRFFAANQLKLLLANISSMYDIEPIPIRPQNPWLNNSIGPPISAKFRVRRRQNTTDPLPNRVVQECSQ